MENNDNSSSDATVFYDCLGFIPKMNSYLFSFIAYEGWGYKIISVENGKTYLLRGIPNFSTDINYFSTLRIDEEGINCGTIELFKCDFSKTGLMFGLWSFDILPVESRWKTDDELYIKAYYKDIVESSIKYYKLNIKKE